MFKTFIILIVGLLCMLKHFTDNSQNGINRRKWSTQHGKRQMSYYDHIWKYLREFWFILFKFTDNCKMFRWCWISMVKINRSGEGGCVVCGYNERYVFAGDSLILVMRKRYMIETKKHTVFIHKNLIINHYFIHP